VKRDSSKCKCGQTIADASVYSYNSKSDRFFCFVCACGFEWTERQQLIDRAASVSSDEVIVVHALLAKFEGSLPELLNRRGE
jgi:hypothetical protein